MNKPISINFAISSRNRPELLAQTLHNLLSEIKAAELFESCVSFSISLRINAGSTQGYERVKKIVSQNGGVILLEDKSDKHVFESYLIAIQAVESDYSWLWGDDDFLTPGALIRLATYLQQTTSLPSAIITDYLHFDDTMGIYERHQHIPAHSTNIRFQNALGLFRHISIGYSGFLSRIIINRKCAIRGFSELQHSQWRVWSQCHALIRAGEEGPIDLLCSTLVAQRKLNYDSNNWLAAGEFQQGIEFPLLALTAKLAAAGDHHTSGNSYSVWASIRMLAKLRALNEPTVNQSVITGIEILHKDRLMPRTVLFVLIRVLSWLYHFRKKELNRDIMSAVQTRATSVASDPVVLALAK